MHLFIAMHFIFISNFAGKNQGSVSSLISFKMQCIEISMHQWHVKPKLQHYLASSLPVKFGGEDIVSIQIPICWSRSYQTFFLRFFSSALT